MANVKRTSGVKYYLFIYGTWCKEKQKVNRDLGGESSSIGWMRGCDRAPTT
jgi:hypothetical protein